MRTATTRISRTTTDQIGIFQMAISPGQRRARLKLCNEVADTGGSLHQAARKCSISPGGLHHWLDRHAPDLLERLASNGIYIRGNPLTPEECRKRLEMVYQTGIPATAGALGITETAIYNFLRRYYPGGKETWLAELKGVV